MDPKSKHSRCRADVLSSLNLFIEGLNLAGKLASLTPAKAVFTVASATECVPFRFVGGSPQADEFHTVLDDR